MKYWILMGDVVDSRLGDQQLLFEGLSELVKSCNERFDQYLLSKLTITLGDEFQGVIESESVFPEILVWLEEQRWKLDVPISLRYCLGFGPIETPINKDIAHGMLGEGLTKTRERLESLKHSEDKFALVGEVANKELKNLATCLYLDQLENWKWKDKELVSNFMEHEDYKIVAENMVKDRSLMWRRSKSLDMDTYFKLKRMLELVFSNNK